MPPRVAYWTSGFEPEMEAISAEVAVLRTRFPSSVAWGLSQRHWVLLSWKRGYCLNPRLHMVFRLATRLLEPAFQLNHIFGSLGDWFYLEGKKRRPIVLTEAAWGPPVQASLWQRVDRFVVEVPGGKDRLVRLGVDPQRIRLIFPPVDLQRFAPGSAPEKPFTVLFASSPDDANWLEARGLPQLLQAASLRPNMHFRLLWRPWGNSAQKIRQAIAQNNLSNVEICQELVKDMPTQYQRAHVTVAPFTDAGRSKPAPNSLIESLACGRPVAATSVVGLADLIQDARAGLICASTGQALAESLDRLQADWDSYALAARRLAERWFNLDRFLREYECLYDEILG